MKKILYILILGLTSIFSFSSCADWLDVAPKTDLPAEENFETARKLRRKLHKTPEIEFDLNETIKTVQSELSRLKIDSKKSVSHYGHFSFRVRLQILHGFGFFGPWTKIFWIIATWA